jgi:serine O-acetyltransferase
MNFSEDIRTVFSKDPAARGFWEVLLCYPGLHAVWLYRPAHWLWTRGFHFPARLLSHIARFLTGVELGGTSLEHKKRHPTLGDGVVVGAGAIVLGAIKVGDRSRIGAASVVLQDIPPDTTVFGVPAHSARGGAGRAQLDHNRLPDYCGEEMRRVQAQLDELKKEIAKK